MGLKLCASLINDKMLGDEAEDFFGDIFRNINELDDDCLSKIISTSFEKLEAEEKEFMQAMSVFPAPFGTHQAQQMFPKNHLKLLRKMRYKSLITEYADEEARALDCRAKSVIHPFIRAYCRQLGVSQMIKT